MDITSLFAVGSKDIAKAYNQTAIAKEHAEEIRDAEKPYKGNNQLKDKRKIKTDPVYCSMLWKQQKILLFTSEIKRRRK